MNMINCYQIGTPWVKQTGGSWIRGYLCICTILIWFRTHSLEAQSQRPLLAVIISWVYYKHIDTTLATTFACFFSIWAISSFSWGKLLKNKKPSKWFNSKGFLLTKYLTFCWSKQIAGPTCRLHPQLQETSPNSSKRPRTGGPWSDSSAQQRSSFTTFLQERPNSVEEETWERAVGLVIFLKWKHIFL